jgi:DNA-binding NarL/FixJ family response regulator
MIADLRPRVVMRGRRDECEALDRLARGGRSNQEIGGQLFSSPKTLECHLGKAFTRLGITSRRQLHHVLRRD